MNKNTNNKVIHINMQSVLGGEDKSIVFDAMQSEANEMNSFMGCDSGLQLGYMKLLSNQIISK